MQDALIYRAMDRDARVRWLQRRRHEGMGPVQIRRIQHAATGGTARAQADAALAKAMQDRAFTLTLFAEVRRLRAEDSDQYGLCPKGTA